MIADLKTYPAMKDSGVPWLGEVPEHWEVRRLKHAFCRIVGGSTPSSANADYWHGDVVWVTPADVSRGLHLKHSLRRITRAGQTACSSELVPAGSIVVTSRAPVGNVAFAEVELCTNQGCKALVANEDVVNPLFGFRVLETLRCELQSLATGTTFTEISTSRLSAVPMPVPPLLEQTAIVRFLDHADRRIRRYIRAKQKLIGLLEEQKQAIIHQAVTGQVDVRTGKPYPAYKDSGVEWLGRVPEGWTSTRLKVVLSRPTQNGIFKRKDQFGIGAPLINVADVYGERFCVEPTSLERVQASADEVRRFRVQAGDIFFVRSSLKLEGTGRSAIATDCSSDTVFECHLVRARPDSGRVNPRYLVVQLNSYAHRHSLISRANVVTMATVAQNTISSCPIMIPPRWEQDGIVQWIDVQWGRIQHVVDGSSRQIRLLREYRTRLIADVVTGKLDVREAAARLPEMDPLAAEDDPDDGLNREAGLEEGSASTDGADAERSEAVAEELITQGR